MLGDEHVEARRAAVRDHIAFLESDEHKARLTIRYAAELRGPMSEAGQLTDP